MADGPPVSIRHVRRTILAVLTEGNVSYGRHAFERMGERKLTTVDIDNVLRDGQVRQPDRDGDDWLYNVETDRMRVVFKFMNEHRIHVVTAVRIAQ